MRHARHGHALVLGKFLPPHAGHLHLVRTAAAHSDRVTVLVCSIARDPIPGVLRAAWMRELAPTIGAHVAVAHVDEELPQEPAEHPRFWEIWTDVCERYAGRVDAVFSSEDYGDELARVLGARHHLVDRAREAYPVSGTAVRADPFRLWEHLPPPVRAHYAARVALVGPESSGKTTLAARLAEAFDTVWLPEYGREHTERIMEATGVPCGAPEFLAHFTTEDIACIGREQAAREDAAARTANRLLVCDTDLVTTRVFSELLFGTCPASVVQASDTRDYGLHLLLAPDIPFVDDGTRGAPERRDAHFARLRERLDAQRRPYEIVRGSFDARLATAIAAIERRWPSIARAR